MGLTVGYPRNMRLRYNPHWRRKRKRGKAGRNAAKEMTTPAIATEGPGK